MLTTIRYYSSTVDISDLFDDSKQTKDIADVVGKKIEAVLIMNLEKETFISKNHLPLINEAYSKLLSTCNNNDKYTITVKIVTGLNTPKYMSEKSRETLAHFIDIAGKFQEEAKSIHEFAEYPKIKSLISLIQTRATTMLNERYHFSNDYLSDTKIIRKKVLTMLQRMNNADNKTNVINNVMIKRINNITVNEKDIIINDTYESLINKVNIAKQMSALKSTTNKKKTKPLVTDTMTKNSTIHN